MYEAGAMIEKLQALKDRGISLAWMTLEQATLHLAI